MTDSEALPPLYRLVQIADRLLGPGGCPWDQAQTHETLKKHLLEEAYEVFEAIDRNDTASLKEELGDLLLQPIMHAQMQKVAGSFDIDEVAEAICDKLVRRHPHVFGNVTASDPEAVLKNWDAIKKTEKGEHSRSLLDGIPRGMPSLLRAHEISKRAARSGFEWETLEDVFAKLREEELELKEAIASEDPHRVEDELGDLLFTAVNIGRWCGAEPEEALRKMLNRFTDRFTAMERSSTTPLSELSPEAWNCLWEAAKAKERAEA